MWRLPTGRPGSPEGRRRQAQPPDLQALPEWLLVVEAVGLLLEVHAAIPSPAAATSAADIVIRRNLRIWSIFRLLGGARNPVESKASAADPGFGGVTMRSSTGALACADESRRMRACQALR